jgi:ribonuclease R
MEERVGEEFDALIISTAKYGLFVELAELFIEGLVPIDTLPGDRYAYHENVRKIIGQRTRREFSIGDCRSWNVHSLSRKRTASPPTTS